VLSKIVGVISSRLFFCCANEKIKTAKIVVEVPSVGATSSLVSDGVGVVVEVVV